MKIAARHSSLITRHSPSGYREAAEVARYLRARWRAQPRVAIVLGTGLQDVVHGLEEMQTIAYKSIPHFPRPSGEGHRGVLHLGQWRGAPVAFLAGRAHLYEGYTPAEVVLPVRALALAGVRVFVMTCAAGGIAPRATPGSFMLFSDHLNFQGASPLTGPHDARWGNRFVDMTVTYDGALRALAGRAARALHIPCFEGVYASLPGPSFETPAEIRSLRRLGADAVGMSTVPEVLAVRQRGARVLAIATITNRAAGLSRTSLRHEEVTEVGQRASPDLSRWLEAILPGLARE
ncbi:MAG: purine-nucleoside phosphorylase [Acidobacteriia bacterium]|nr:purine-nucleoside phosphorylase [Terriglobia bacterium]